MTRSARSLIGDAQGAVMLEFLVTTLPLFVFFLACLQLALLFVAELVVQHAAITGVRAAIVVLADEPRFYAGEPVRSIRHGGERLAAIRSAVAHPLAAIAPDPGIAFDLMHDSAGSVARELGAAPAARLAAALGSYDAAATAVTFPIAPHAKQLFDAAVEPSGEVTVRVTHLFRCGVPLVAPLLCSTLLATDLRAIFDDERKQALAELKRAPLAAFHALWRVSPVRFRVLRAEATLPSQYAEYVGREASP